MRIMQVGKLDTPQPRSALTLMSPKKREKKEKMVYIIRDGGYPGD